MVNLRGCLEHVVEVAPATQVAVVDLQGCSLLVFGREFGEKMGLFNR